MEKLRLKRVDFVFVFVVVFTLFLRRPTYTETFNEKKKGKGFKTMT